MVKLIQPIVVKGTGFSNEYQNFDAKYIIGIKKTN
jgi:hypothetical protein